MPLNNRYANLPGPPLSPTEARVLVVDDHPANILLLHSLLDGLGYTLVQADSGAAAVRQAESDEFAVILLDVLMAGMDGFETARRIRKQGRAQHTPIIFLTAGDTDGAQLEEGYRLGAVDYLTKPVKPFILQAKVRSLVQLYLDKRSAAREAEQLRMLVHATTDYAIFMLDPSGIVITWNQGAERLKGYSADEIIGQHFSRFYPQEAIDRGWPGHELEVAGRDGRFEDEGWRVRTDGTLFWANVVITALRDEHGELRGFSKITRDLTERKQAEDKAKQLIAESTARRVAEENARLINEQRERLSVTLASIGDAVISTDAEGRIDFLNPVAQALLGWNRDEVARRPLSEVFRIVNEGTREPVPNPALRALQEGVVVGLANHTVLIAKDGSEYSIDDSAAPIRDADGQIVGSILVFRDISERKRRQEELQQSEQRLRLAMDSGRMGVWEWNIRTEQMIWSESLERLHGLLPGTFGGTLDDFKSLVHPADRQSVAAAIRHSMEVDPNYEVEFRVIWRNGGVHWISAKGMVLPGSDGRPERLIGLAMDITHRHRAEHASKFLADASAALAVLVDFDSTLQKVASLAVPHFADWATVDLLEANGSLRRVAVAHVDRTKIALAHELHRRFPPDQEALHGVWHIIRSGKAELISEINDTVLSETIRDPELIALLRELGLKSYIGVPLKVRGKTLGVATFISAESGYLYDATDLAVAHELADRGAIAIENTRLYHELRDADRRKDEFLATLAHELRNPLAPLRNSVQILKMSRVDSETLQQTRDMMERQVQHLVRLVDDLLDVSRVMRGKIELRREHIEMATIVARAVETATPFIEGPGHQLEISLPDESLRLYADPVRLVQVVGNLLTNAAKYSEANGHIWLRARREGNEAVLSIKDTGIGIAPDMLPHVFELFVQADSATSKAQGGLGIGLTLVKNLVELHKGNVSARSEGLGKGAEFIVRLPLSFPEQNLMTSTDESETMPESLIVSHRLLVVDDNYDAAMSLAILLRLMGHTVEVAHDGSAAVQIVRSSKPDLVFLDIGMPGMDGYEVARQIRGTPGLERTVLAALTGWGQQEDRRRTAEAGFDYHLVKPPEPELIQQLISGLPKSKNL